MKERYQKILEKSKDYDFRRLAKLAKNPREKIRYLAFVHLKKGNTAIEVAQLLLTTRQSVYEWMRRFEQKELEGLREQKGRGRKLSLSPAEHAAFKQAVLTLQDKREGGVINGVDILAMMANKFGVRCTQRSIYNYLRRAKLVWISSRSKHPKADFEKQEAFKKTSKKKS